MTEDQEMVMVKFIKPYSDRFTGTDLRAYGPFDEGDIVRMPPANADILSDRGFVERYGSD